MATTTEQKAALTQVFKVSVPNGVSGMYATSIDLFFRKKSKSFGLELTVVELTDGQPDQSKVVSNSSVMVPSEEVAVSNNATAPTKFKFTNPIWLEADARYAFTLRALGGSPDFEIWTGLNGAKDINSGKNISSNPLSESAYFAKSTADWAEIPNEDIKYKVYRAKFNTTGARVMLRKADTEIFRLRNIKWASGFPALIAGDEVYSKSPNGNLTDTHYAKVTAYDDVNNMLYLQSSTGNFENGMKLVIVRPSAERAMTKASTQAGVLAEVELAEMLDYPIHAIVPKIGDKSNSLGAVSFEFRGTYMEGNPLMPVKETANSAWKAVTNHEETDFYDRSRYVLSRSKETAQLSGNSSVDLRANLTTSSDFVSPVIDLRERSLIGIKNLIGSDTTGEETVYGAARTKYVSKIVTLADGQEAEDLKVYITAYKPPRTKVMVYAKVWNPEDTEPFDVKKWTLMSQVTDSNLFSDPKNVEDYREFEFDMPTEQQQPGTAWVANSSDPVQYIGPDGTYVGYKKYAVKVVMGVATDEDAHNYPRLSDIRAIALQK